MSCYGWERGEVQLPAAEFTKFKKELIAKLIQRQEYVFNTAVAVYTKIKENKVKEQENADFIYEYLKKFNLSQHDHWVVVNSLIKDKTKLLKPKKKDFSIDKENLSFNDSDLTVSLNKESRTVSYRTDDNNHSIDEARETFLGRNVISMLERVKYSTQTGGYFKSQTEYDVDNGTGARVTETFGKYTNPKYRKELCRC